MERERDSQASKYEIYRSVSKKGTYIRINATASDEPVVTNTEKSSYSSSSDEPEYGSDDYVKK